MKGSYLALYSIVFVSCKSLHGYNQAITADAFIGPPADARSGHRRRIPTGRRSASSTDYAQSSSGASAFSDGTRGIRFSLRDAIWKATDAVAHAVDDLPAIGQNETLARLGDFMTDMDEKYFSKYRGVGATNGYLESISTSPNKDNRRTNRGEEGNSGEDKDSKGSTNPVLASAVQEAAALSPKAQTGETSPSTKVESTGSSAFTGDGVGSALSTPSSPSLEGTSTSTGRVSATPPPSVPSGTVQLDRPRRIQGLFDNIQKKAVEYYKQSPASSFNSDSRKMEIVGEALQQSSPVPWNVASLPPEAKKIEADLEALLESSGFCPRALDKDGRAEMAEIFTAMENVYPQDAAPLADSALSGEWTLVYSSSSKSMRKIVRGLLVRLFKMSATKQDIDKQQASITNTCRARLRLTPFHLRIAQSGSYTVSKTQTGAEGAARKVDVDLPKKRWGLLPRFRAGTLEAEVTYLSRRWRICRAAGTIAAFRKRET